MKFKAKLIKYGMYSLGIIIPKSILSSKKLKVGDHVLIDMRKAK